MFSDELVCFPLPCAHSCIVLLFTSAHTGTHVDAPIHFIDKGAGIETLDLNILIGGLHWTPVHCSAAAPVAAAAAGGLQLPCLPQQDRTRPETAWCL